jgi:hypothetical protein
LKKNTKRISVFEKKNRRIVNFGYNFKTLRILVGFMKKLTKKKT